MAAFAYKGFDTAKARYVLPCHLSGVDTRELNAADFSFHNCVICRGLVVVYEQGMTEFPIPCPCVPCDDTSASTMWNCLNSVESSAIIVTVLNKVLRAATVSEEAYAMDGAYGNVKMFADDENKAGAEPNPRPMYAHLCSNHRLHLVERPVTDAANDFHPAAADAVNNTASFVRTDSFLFQAPRARVSCAEGGR